MTGSDSQYIVQSLPPAPSTDHLTGDRRLGERNIPDCGGLIGVGPSSASTFLVSLELCEPSVGDEADGSGNCGGDIDRGGVLALLATAAVVLGCAPLTGVAANAMVADAGGEDEPGDDRCSLDLDDIWSAVLRESTAIMIKILNIQ